MADFSKYYRAYMYMYELLQNDFTYNYIKEGLKDGDKGEDALDGKTNEKAIDMDWVEAIEDVLPYIQKAIDEQRRFIKEYAEIVRIELAKKVGPDSVKHLSQHTNLIAKVEGDMVTPKKVLTIEREDSFAIYENRFLMTLIRRAINFVDNKYSKMKDVPDDSYNKISVKRHLVVNENKADFVIGYSREAHERLADNLDVLDVSELSDFDRIRRIRKTLNEFLNTQLMQTIAKEPEVRPPITQTNLLKKNPNYKKAMELWNFLDTYKRDGFEVVSEDYSGKMSDRVKEDVYFTMGFEHFMMCIATNPGLRKILHQKYEDENARIAAEAAQPEKTRESVMKAKLEAVRKEEMEIRLKEIREREKKIQDLTTEIRSLKATLEQKEQQILVLKGRISALEDEITRLKAELQEVKLKLLEAEKEIERLKEENAQLKAKIAELEQHIDELNETIDKLNKQIIVLNDRVQVLMQENARQKTKIEEQAKQIEEQTAKINELETQVAEQIATIAALTDNVAKCEAQIAEDERQINSLTDKNEKLTSTLQTERQQTKEREEKMNADFAEKTRLAQEKHNAEVKTLNDTIDNTNAAHAEEIARLNSDFAEKANIAEQKRIKDLSDKQQEFEAQLVNIKNSNEAAAAAVSAKHQSEIKKVQKSVDKRVEAAEKAAEKRFDAKVKEIKKNAQNEIKEADRKANEKAMAAKDEAKAVKKSIDFVSKDYSFGCIKMVSAYAQMLAESGSDNLAAVLSDTAKSIKALTVTKSKKGMLLSWYSPLGIKTVKLYKKSDSHIDALNDVVEQLGTATDAPVFVTYSGVEKAVAESFAAKIKARGFEKALLAHNKTLKADGMVAIYICKK